MVRDAFLVSELVRIDCLGLEKKDYKKIGAKLRVSAHVVSLSVTLFVVSCYCLIEENTLTYQSIVV